MAAPSTTLNQEVIGDGAGGQTTIAGGGSDTGQLNLTDDYEAAVQVEVAFGGTVADGVTINAYRAVDSTSSPTFDTEPQFSFTIPETASTTKRDSFVLPTGMWQIEVVNDDGSNPVDVLVLAGIVGDVS